MAYEVNLGIGATAGITTFVLDGLAANPAPPDVGGGANSRQVYLAPIPLAIRRDTIDYTPYAKPRVPSPAPLSF